MRNGTRGYLVLALIAGAAVAWGKPPAVDGDRHDPDAEFLEEVGVGSSDAELLECLRNRAVGHVQPDRVDRLLRALGSDNFRERDRATSELIRIGAPAREPLRRAAADKDTEIATRAQACLKLLERDIDLDMPQAAVRLLVRRRVDGAEETLLQYLPSARDEGEEEEIVYGLDALAVGRGRLVAALRAALESKSPACRAAAACIVGRRGSTEDRAAVRRLLADPSPLVRLRSAQGLLAAGDKAGLPPLIALLDEPPVTISWQAEELLHWAAWGDPPVEIVGAGTPEERQQCRAAWEEWYRQHGPGLDLSKPTAERRPGLLLICSSDTDLGRAKSGKVFLYGCDGKPRWKLEGPLFSDAQLLPGNRILAATLDHATERSLRGKVLWQDKPARHGITMAVCRRLRSGNTFVADSGGMACELGPKGAEAVAYYRVLADNGCFPSTHSELYPLGNGCLAYVDRDGDLVQADRITGRVRRQLPLGKDGDAELVALDLLPNGNWLLAASPALHYLHSGQPPQSAKWAPQVLEVDAAGKIAWRCQAFAGISAARLGDGNTVLCTSFYMNTPTPALVEFDPTGRKVWEDLNLRYVRRVRACLPLVSLGFDRIPAAVVDWDAAQRRAKELKDSDPEKRWRAIQFLLALGPKGASAIPALIDALDNPDPRVSGNATVALSQIGTAALQPTVEALGDRRPGVRAGAVEVLGHLKFRGNIHQDAGSLVPKLLAALHDDSALVRRQATWAVGCFAADSDAVVPALVQALQDKDKAASQRELSVAQRAADSLGSTCARFRAKAAIPALLETIKADDERLQRAAFSSVGRIAAADPAAVPTALPTLLELLKDKEPPAHRELALAALEDMGAAARTAVPALRQALKARDVSDPRLAKMIRVSVLCALQRIGPGAAEAVQDMIGILEDEGRDPEERRFAAAALGGVGAAAAPALPALARAAESKDLNLGKTAADAMKQIRP